MLNNYFSIALEKIIEGDGNIGYEFVRANKGYIDFIVKFKIKMRRESKHLNSQPANKELEGRTMKYMDELNYHYTLVLFNGNMVGLSFATIDEDVDSEEKSTHLNLIAVLKEHSGNWLGSILLNKVREYAMLNKCKKISLYVLKDNSAARALYKKLNFKDIERSVWYEMACVL